MKYYNLPRTVSQNDSDSFWGDGQPVLGSSPKIQFFDIEIVDVHLEFDMLFLFFSCEHGLSCWKPVDFFGQLHLGSMSFRHERAIIAIDIR